MSTYFYVKPTDSLFVRGNLAFGDAGEHGASLMPPPPSLLAGAFRSAILGRNADEMHAFLARGQCDDGRFHACLGRAEAPGAFRLSWLSLAGMSAAAAEQGLPPEAVTPLPADLLHLESGFAPLQPRGTAEFVGSAGELPLRATLISRKQEKPKSGVYLRQAGLTRHMQGTCPDMTDAVNVQDLHQRDPRLGIGLATESRSVEDGLIYTTEGFSFSPASTAGTSRPYVSTGFLVGVEGADGLLPDAGQLRLGGDGRSASYQRVAFLPPCANAVPGADGQFRLILQTPALFMQGWLPDGIVQDGDQYRLVGSGFSARLVCAALGRREIISGWDLFNWRPKPAQAAVPAGSVYWFDQFDGDPGKLAVWIANGMCVENGTAVAPKDFHAMGSAKVRLAEGFNLAWLAAWQN